MSYDRRIFILATVLLWGCLPGVKTFASNWEHQGSPWSAPDPGWALDYPNGMAWVLGPDGTTIRSPVETPQQTGLSWSIVPLSTNDTDSSTWLKYTQSLLALGVDFPFGGPQGIEGYKYVLGGVMDEWASVCGITNLGYVEEDGSVLVGGVPDTNGDGILHITDRGPAAGVGHIRFMAYDSSWINPSVYAQATYIAEPGSQVDNAGNNPKAGDVRFRSDADIWGMGADMLHFRNIALHEVGHVLGFGHNNISDSVMSWPYTEWNLGAGDIEGAIAVYGPVPEPHTLSLLGFALLAVTGRVRRVNLDVPRTAGASLWGGRRRWRGAATSRL